MTLSRAAYYAFSALAHMTTCAGPVSSGKLAEENGIPARFLLKVMRRLVKGGVVSSSKGPTGGYVLARCPTKITLLDVIEAVDGSLEPKLDVPCPPGTHALFRYKHLAPRLLSVYKQATSGLRSGFAGFTLAQLAGKE